MTRSPLFWAAPLRTLRGGLSGALIVAGFAGVALAAAAPPLFAEAAANATFSRILEAVPADAQTSQGSSVRISGSRGDLVPEGARGDTTRWVESLGGIAGLGPVRQFSRSFGQELSSRSRPVTGVVVAGGTVADARVVGVPVPADVLRTDGSEAAAGAEAGAWLPAPLADELGVGVGDAVQSGVDTRDGRVLSDVTVAGVYQVDDDGRTPTDRDGSDYWSYWQDQLPRNVEFGTEVAPLIVTDIDVAEALAATVGDSMLKVIDTDLDDPDVSLADAREIAGELEELRQEIVQRENGVTTVQDPRRWRLVTGLPTLVEDSSRLSAAITVRSTTVTVAGLIVAFAAMLAVGLLNARDRRLELRLDAALGQTPVMVALRYGLGALPPAAIGLAIGAAAAWGIVTGVGPPGRTSRGVLVSAVEQATVATGAAVVLVVTVYGSAAALAARPDPAATRRVRVPWEFALVVALATALAGLFGRPAEQQPPVGLTLVVPVLAVAALGAVGGALVMAAVRLSFRSAGARIATRAAAVRSLALRRVATAAGSLVIVTLLTASLGTLGYTVASGSAVDRAIADKVATVGGASATSPIEASWPFDPQAPELPVATPEEPQPPLPARRQPPLPDGATVVWHDSVIIPAEEVDLGLMVVDPASFEIAADWGTGRALQQAREALRVLADAEQTAATGSPGASAGGELPVTVIGSEGVAAGDTFRASTPNAQFSARVVAVSETFPGFDSGAPVVVVPADLYLSRLDTLDPRFREPIGSFLSAEVWSAGGVTGLVTLLTSVGLDADDVDSAALVAERPPFVVARTGGQYQLAIAVGVAGMALVAVCLHADRRAAESRAADVLLARIGLGSRGPGRARTLELVTLVLLSVVLAMAGVTALTPLGARLLDPAPRLLPMLYLQPDPSAYLVMTVAGTMMAAGAVTVATVRSRTGSDGAVLRDAE